MRFLLVFFVFSHGYIQLRTEYSIVWLPTFSLTLLVFYIQEQKIKESLYMMGLKDEIFHLSWFITYALQVSFMYVFVSSHYFCMPSLCCCLLKMSDVIFYFGL